VQSARQKKKKGNDKMAPHTRTRTGKSKKKKKTAAMDDVDDDNYNDNDTEGEKDTKRQRTDDVVPPEPVASATGTAVSANNRESDDDELPSSDELSEELCNIISTRYSRDEALRTLDRLSKWASTQDSDFLRSFHRYSGVVKVLDFLKKTMKDGNCIGAVRMECIKKAASVIVNVVHTGRNNENVDIATKIAITLMECDGINTLINASEEYAGGDDVPQLHALRTVWFALRNITHAQDAIKDAINKDQVIVFFDTGIDIISQLKSVDIPLASNALEQVFSSLHNIVLLNYVTKKYFQDKNIISKCLVVFKKDDTWNCRSEALMRTAIGFFRTCQFENLLDKSSDYEMLLPLLVMALKQYPSNDDIRKYVLSLLDGACTTINDKKTIVRSGAMEVLGALFTSDDINEDGKDAVRILIHKISAP
jgi:hypothetical protein